MSDVCNSCGSAGIVENGDPRAEQVTTVRPCQYCIAPRVTLLCDRCRIHHESVCKVNAARLGRGEGATVRTQPTLRTVSTTPVRPEIFVDTPVVISKLEVTAEELENFRTDEPIWGEEVGDITEVPAEDGTTAVFVNAGKLVNIDTIAADLIAKADALAASDQQASEFAVKFNDSDKLAAELANTDGAEQAPEIEITEFIPETEDVKVVNPDEEVSNQDA